ncbi:MAG: hypothetical protein O2U61_04740, partial [Candidatus Bathyarchaeota archaeon]|nr:hypothetical protein [Candidatus Bathyarchaeota archaeon]
MPSRLASQLKVQFLGVIPYIKEERKDETLSPQQIVSLSGILTLRGQSLKTIFRQIKSEKQDLNEKIKFILKESSLRGHASMSTTPVVCLTFEGSKFLDSALTGIIFSSSMMASGRRTDTSIRDIVYPDKIYHRKYC